MEIAADALGFNDHAKVQKLNEMTDLYLEMDHLHQAYKVKLTQWKTLRDVIRPQLSTPKHSFDDEE